MSVVSSNIYVFFGPPGSGKGSLSSLCVQKLGWIQLSTGNLCRQEIAHGTEIGQQIDFLIKSGKLVPDGLITRMLEGALTQHRKGSSPVILDGYPRTIPQAQELSRILSKEEFRDMDLILVKLRVADEVVVKRMTGRLICSNETCQTVYSMNTEALAPVRFMECDICSSTLVRRADDNESAIRDRLITYYGHEKGLIDYYKQHNYRIQEFSVEKTLDEVFHEFENMIVRASNDYD